MWNRKYARHCMLANLRQTELFSKKYCHISSLDLSWPLGSQKWHAALVWPSHPLLAVSGEDKVPSKTLEQSAPSAGCVRLSQWLHLWDCGLLAGRTPARRSSHEHQLHYMRTCKISYILLSTGWSFHFLCILTSGTSSYSEQTPWMFHQWGLWHYKAHSLGQLNTTGMKVGGKYALFKRILGFNKMCHFLLVIPVHLCTVLDCTLTCIVQFKQV